MRQESFISLERTRSGAIGISSSDTLTRAPMLGRSWLSERYAGRPQRLSAHMILTHTQSSAVPTARALTSRGSAPHHRALSCEALMIHARVVITRGGCVVTPKQLSRLARADDLKSVGDQGPIASVVRSLVNQDNSIALHLLSAPLPFVPVLVGVSTHKSRYDEMILREGLARYGALDDSILISPSAHYAQYGPFIVRKDERTFNQLSAMIGERGGERGEERGEERVGARVLDASDRAWIQQAIHTLTQEPLL